MLIFLLRTIALAKKISKNRYLYLVIELLPTKEIEKKTRPDPQYLLIREASFH